MYRIIVPMILASVISAHAQEPDWSGSYYCKMTASGGVNFNKTTNAWEATVFNVESKSHTITVSATGETFPTILGLVPTYRISVNENGRTYKCSDHSDPRNNDDYVPIFASGGAYCEWLGGMHHFNFKEMKMQTIYEGGYVEAGGANKDSAAVAISKCDKVS